jgi:riboflavin kinase / FMN adenylyltransferase
LRIVELNNADHFVHTGCVVALGNFDGVHLGHQHLLKTLCAEAKKRQLPAVVVTFSPYPQEFFFPDRPFLKLQRLSEKSICLREFGVDQVVFLRFNQTFAGISAKDFILRYLVELWQAQLVVAGDDLRFGAGRHGNVNTLREAGAKYGFGVIEKGSFLVRGCRVSSSKIRQLLQQGALTEAQQLLGRPYSVTARVVYGDQRGREWGFPTANLPLFRSVPPVQGVFAVKVFGQDFAAEGVASIGFRPVFKLKKPLLEVHILDFDRMIYGQRLRVEFLHKIRDEADFKSLDALKQRIQEDVIAARVFFDRYSVSE